MMYVSSRLVRVAHASGLRRTCVATGCTLVAASTCAAAAALGAAAARTAAGRCLPRVASARTPPAWNTWLKTPDPVKHRTTGYTPIARLHARLMARHLVKICIEHRGTLAAYLLHRAYARGRHVGLGSDAPAARAALSAAELPSHITTVTAACESAVACNAGVRCVDSRPLRAARVMEAQPDWTSQIATVVPSAPVPPMTRQLRRLRWPAAAGNRLQPRARHI